RLRRAAQDAAAKQRAGANAQQDYGQQQREHRAEAAKQDAEVPEPENLHTERGKPRHRECDGGPDHSGVSMSRLTTFAKATVVRRSFMRRRKPAPTSVICVTVRLKPDTTDVVGVAAFPLFLRRSVRLQLLRRSVRLQLLRRSVRLQADRLT